jgi:hypothetical protein
MKIQDTPRTGALGRTVAWQSRYGLCLRERIVPRNNRTPACQFMRAAFGHHSQAFSYILTDEQQDRWALVGAQVMTDPSLGQYGPMTAQQLYTAINSVRSRVNTPETLEPPAQVTFARNCVGELVIEQTEAGVRLLLRITGELTEDVMVFGQAPCSPGRSKRRNVSYLGLLPPPINGYSDITYLYRARYGEPRPNTRVFIVTCQQKDGWKGFDHETQARVPEPPKSPQAPLAASPNQILHMHKGSSSDATGQEARAPSYPQGGNKAEPGGETGSSPINMEPGGGGGGLG